MTRASLAVVVLAVLLAGCGGGDGEPSAETTEPSTIELRVYFLLDGKVWPVRRVVGYTELVERAVLDQLVAGPSDQELEDFGFSNEPFQAIHRTGALFPSSARFQGLVVEDEVVRVEVPHDLREDGVAQVVFTLTQFPAITAVDVVMGGSKRRLRRADYERFTPPVLVESPLAYEDVSSPLRLTGVAKTAFRYELRGAGGVLASGERPRGTFDLDVDFDASEAGDGTLVVGGAGAGEVAVPLRLAP